eukprot:CAMPEP_0170161022 /NCGR_PEP_ID=MMETSP0033_2-20121228/74998_1 /TAXON_ID=195969 /ORGANISM="Dolichomastix tenuilepis, Strain CCMP3274" /LENGTH=100 /DNA_ID=CAMNT_0010398611 /DNA_START=130 /DNA_END=429 /DNA_ORIENTATION=+
MGGLDSSSEARSVFRAGACTRGAAAAAAAEAPNIFSRPRALAAVRRARPSACARVSPRHSPARALTRALGRRLSTVVESPTADVELDPRSRPSLCPPSSS